MLGIAVAARGAAKAADSPSGAGVGLELDLVLAPGAGPELTLGAGVERGAVVKVAPGDIVEAELGRAVVGVGPGARVGSAASVSFVMLTFSLRINPC